MSVFQELEDRGARCCFVAEDGTRCDQASTHGTPRVTACELHSLMLSSTPVVPPDSSDGDRQATAAALTPPELTPG